MFVKQVLERISVVRGRDYKGEQHIFLVNLNKCCDFDDLLIDAYLKESYCINQQSMNFF